MQKLELRLAREGDEVEQIASSVSNFVVTSEGIHFPDNLKELRILDIGGGASTVVFELRKRGADAISIDPRFENLKTFRSAVGQYINEAEKYADSPVFALATNKVWDTTKRRMRQTRDAFFNKVKRGEKPFIIAIAGNLPFQNNKFDFCFSENAISPGLLFDPEVALNAIREILRVLKNGGQAQIHPWYKPDSYEQSQRGRNALQVVKFLRKSGIRHSVELFTPRDILLNSRTLVIFK